MPDGNVVEGLVSVLSLDSLSGSVSFHAIVGNPHLPHNVMAVGDLELLSKNVSQQLGSVTHVDIHIRVVSEFFVADNVGDVGVVVQGPLFGLVFPR